MDEILELAMELREHLKRFIESSIKVYIMSFSSSGQSFFLWSSSF